ncbi:ATP-dependent DNA helicase [Arthrobacter sp. H20]|uniref:ATP-dependent helicase n=1 Tax=Arthrobacter sp. H20 TaxID=1267981 RepID=UPI000479F4B8|nr:ATP-dependent DNA helicase [Arthrobacter sp. H20]
MRTTSEPDSRGVVQVADGPARRFSARDLAALLHRDPATPVQYPTPDQVTIIEAPLEPLLVIAGAGSGKTKTMADRVVWLVANGLVRPEQILGVTFTKKAAGELSTRIRQQLSALYPALVAEGIGETTEDGLDPSVSTYHSYANAIVQDYGLRIGVERDSAMLGAAQAWQLASSVVEAYEGEWEHFSAAKSTLVKAVLTMAGECAEHLVTPAEVRAVLREHISIVGDLEYAAGTARRPAQTVGKMLDKLRTRVTVTELVEHYSDAKHSRRQLDFGDLVALAARIVSDIPEAVEMERQKYQVVLLDEFQDTSFAQMVLFSKLFGDGRGVTAVGDPHQSIYGFRGASAGQLGTFRTTFPLTVDDGLRPSPVANLSVAWRNGTSILAAANAVASELNRQPGWQKTSTLLVPALEPKPQAGVGEVYLGRYLCEATVSLGDGTVTGESAALADQVERHRRRSFERGTDGRALKPTVAVLCRGRRQFEPIRRELVQRGIPVQIVGLGGLLRTPEIVEILAVLRVLGDPDRSDSLLRLLSSARWRLGPADIMALGDWSRQLARRRQWSTSVNESAQKSVHSADQAVQRDGEGLPGIESTVLPDAVELGSLVEAVDQLPPVDWVSGSGRELSSEGRTRLVRLRDELRVLRDFVGDDLTTLINEVERRILLDIEVAAKPQVGIHEARRNLDAFVEAVAGFSSTAERVDLSAFLAWLEAADAEEDGLPVTALETNRDAVQLLTVHAAKGLEWDIVAVPGLNEGAFPSGSDSRWSSGDSAIPWNLRGDAAELPQWDWEQVDQVSWIASEKDFTAEARYHAEREERRLAYVAFTRSKHVLVCTSSAWGAGRTKPTSASTYLTELRELADEHQPGFTVLHWLREGAEGDTNPANVAQARVAWPSDPLGLRRQGIESAAAAVLSAAATGNGIDGQTDTAGADLRALKGGRWSEETRLALARHSRSTSSPAVELPAHISASLLVELSDDPAAVARQLRRPVPRRPGMAARRGTAFHTWIEEYYGTSGMLDLGETPGVDSHIDEALDLDSMIATFKGSVWAQRLPTELEVPIETKVGSLVVRGRIDAVFRGDDGGWELVDWKTGTPPSREKLAVRSVQLAVYRLAWARLKAVPLESVQAAFYYASTDTLIRPYDLADEAGLEEIIERATSANPGAVAP